MFSTAARAAAALALVTLFALFASTAGPTRAADDDDPVYEGKKLSAWVAASQPGETSARKRALAVDALGKIAIANQGKKKIVTAAISAINVALRSDTSAAVKVQAAITLAGMRPADRDLFEKDLIEALSKEKESRVRKEIIAAMAKFPETCNLGVDPLITCLKDEDNAVKIAAAEAIALAGTQPMSKAKEAAPGLVPLLKDTDKAVRTAAVYALGRIKPEGASTVSETLAAMLGTEKDADMKREIIASIGLLSEKAEPVIKALTAALFDPDDEVRRSSARVLGTFGTAAVTVADELLKVINTDSVKDIRVDAVHALGSAVGPLGMKARLKILRPMLDPSKKSNFQPDFEVRLALVEEIAALGYEHVGADLPAPGQFAAAMGTIVNCRWDDFGRDFAQLVKYSEAQETVTALRLSKADPQVAVRKAATAALKKVETKPEPKKDPDKKAPDKPE